MRRLIATEYVTLDGVMEAPGNETSLGERGGWSFLFSNDEHRQFKWDELLASDALLLGQVSVFSKTGIASIWILSNARC